MFDYGNALGNGWILKTYYKKLIQEMKSEFKDYTPGKTSVMDRITGKAGKREGGNPIEKWVNEKERTCYICDRFHEVYERYIATFFICTKRTRPSGKRLRTERASVSTILQSCAQGRTGI